MQYHRDSGSERHRTDIEGILELSADRIDEGVLASWAERLGLEDALRRVRGDL